MSYKPTDTFIPSNTNGNFYKDYSGAAKSYKVSITKPTKYPGEEKTNAIIWLLDLEAYSSIDPASAHDLAGRDLDSDPTGNTTYPTKGNYYMFASIFSYPDKNPKDGSELYDPWHSIVQRDGVKSIRVDLGSSLQRVKYGELTANNTQDDVINLVLNYIKSSYIDIIYARKKSTTWLDALKKYDAKEISDAELNKVYKDLANLEENKVSFFIGDDVPETPKPEPSATQSVAIAATSSATTATASQPKEYTFDVQIKDTFYNADIGFLTITGKVDDTFVYGDEQDTIDPEYLEEPFVGEEEQLITLEAINVEALNDIKGFDPENPDPSISTDAGSPYPIPKNKQANISAIVAAMKRHKITNKYTQAAILAIVSKESAFVPRNEGSYAKTSATRIKSIFAAFRKYSDSEVDRIKKIPKQFFDIIYGGKNGNAADEGYKYRGRGFNQLTFKGLYLEAQNKTGHKIVADPDLLNTIEVASDCIVVYFLQRMAGMPSKYRTQYNTSGAINDFKTLNDAVGAIYHANAGWGHSYSLIVADSTGGRRKAFAAAPSLYSNLA